MTSMSDPPPIRVGNREREAAVRELGEHFGEGRLDPHEYEERTAAAYAARTAAELDALFVDLPRGGDTAAVPYPTPAYPHPAAHRGTTDPAAPYGREPVTGAAYSGRYKVIAGVLQIVLPFGVGRFYTGHMGIGVAQLLLSFIGIGVIWAFIDGILMLIGRPLDREGRPLRP